MEVGGRGEPRARFAVAALAATALAVACITTLVLRRGDAGEFDRGATRPSADAGEPSRSDLRAPPDAVASGSSAARAALVVRGRVIAPDAPHDDALAVAAYAAPPDLDWEGVFGATSEELLALAEPLARAAVDASGAFELALPDARPVHLAVLGRFLSLGRAAPLAPDEDGDVALRPELRASIRGRVAGAGAGVAVVCGQDHAATPPGHYAAGEPPLRVAFTDAEGRFELDGASARGAWWIAARPEGGEGALALARNLALAPGEELVVELTPERAWSLSGRVTEPGGDPVAGATIEAGPRDLDLLPGLHHVLPSAWSRSDGSFRLRGVGGGPRVIRARLGACEATLEVDVDGDREGLELLLDVGPAVLGRVLHADGRPAEGALVEALGWSDAARTAEDGAFRLTCCGVEVGDEVLLHASAPGGLTADATARAAVPVELVLRASSSVEPALEPSARGRVVAPDGSPVEGAELYVGAAASLADDLEDGAPWLGRGTFRFSDARGGFDAPIGSAVVARAPGFAPSALVEVSGDAGLEVALRAGGALAGVVRGAQGEPARNVEVSVQRREGGDGGHALTGRDGAYRFDALLPGTYAIVATPAGASSRAVRASHVRRVEVAEGAVALLDLTLRSR